MPPKKTTPSSMTKPAIVVKQVPAPAASSKRTPEDLAIEEALAKAASFRDDAPHQRERKSVVKKLAKYAEEDVANEQASAHSTEEEPDLDWEPTEWIPKFVRATESKQHWSSIMASSRSGGKSYLTKYLIEKRMVGLFDLAFVVCGSPAERDNYVTILESIHVIVTGFSDLPPDLWPRIKQLQQERKDTGKPMLNILLLFDDSVGLKYNKDLLDIYCTGRHHFVSCFFLIQSLTLLEPNVRANTDVWCILKMKSAKFRASVIEQVLQGLVDLDVKPGEEKRFYQRLLSTYAKKQGDALVVDTRDPKVRGNQEDAELFRYRAPGPETFEEEDS